MRRLVLPTLLGLSLLLPMSLASCGDDSTGDANCGPGTTLQNGQCIADSDTGATNQPDTANTGQPDTANTSQPDTTNTTGTTDTGTPMDTDPGECGAGEVESKEVGQACTRNCECAHQDGGGYCYNGPFMAPFRFCTIPSTFNNPDFDRYQQLSTNRVCVGYDNTATKVYLRKCQSLSDCRAIASQYTHCGTQELYSGVLTSSPPTGCAYTQESGGACDVVTLAASKTCIIATAPPFGGTCADD